MGQRKAKKISDDVIRIVFEGGVPQGEIQLRRHGNTSTKGIGERRFRAENMTNNRGMRVGTRE